LRLVEGRWKIELWAKAQRPGETLEIKFHRVQQNIFFKETIPLTTYWQKIERSFDVPVGIDRLQGDSSSLSYEIRIASGEGDVWIDDLYLGRVDHANRTVFSDNYVNILRELRPGVLRNWGNQLGSSLQNQLAVPTARKTVGSHPYTANPGKFHYSLHEFLQLAQAVGAEPWYVIPPTFNGQEMQNLAAYLSAPVGSHPYANLRAELGQPTPWTNIFRTIHLEYGNEMWGPNSHGDPFLGASLSGGARVGEVADGRFQVMRRSPYFQEGRLNFIVGGQAFNPWQQGQIEANSDAHDTIGIAPYFGDLTSYGNTGQMYYPLFASPTQQMAETNAGKIRGNVDELQRSGQGTELAIYEINSHYNYGWTPLQVRNDYLTSMGMGLALPLHMLTYQRDAGINTQAAFTSLQYSSLMPGKSERARLWGLLRDVEATQRKRPGWLGLEMANHAIRGTMISTVQSGYNPTWTQQAINKISDRVVVPYVQSFAYKGAQGDYAMVLFNLHLNQTQVVQLRLPSAPWGQATLYTLTATDIRADNENAENVVITTEQRTIGQSHTLELRPHSMYVLEWRGN
ncbi:MAG: hypothetical protein KAG66_02500, partial [Methylococcales bacterium]|nr:hypothetical protein [Methylococcales bacterium]